MPTPSPSPARDTTGLLPAASTPKATVKRRSSASASAAKPQLEESPPAGDSASAPSSSSAIVAAAHAAFEDGRITVCVRARPLNHREERVSGVPSHTVGGGADTSDGKEAGSLFSGGPTCLRVFADGKTVAIFDGGLPPTYAELSREQMLALHQRRTHTFTFDHAYDVTVPQDTVYADMGRPVLAASFLGFNTCIFAYGQTGSGKSYCMMGPDGGRNASAAPGIIPRLCRDLFEQMEERRRLNNAEIQTVEAARERRGNMASASEGRDDHGFGPDGVSRADARCRSVASGSGVSGEEVEMADTTLTPPELDMHVYVSYLEIYREKVRCLLNPKSDNLKVRQHPSLGVYVEGLKEVPVSHEDQVIKLMRAGTESRHTASTSMNDTSSRSHAIVQLQLIQKRKSMTGDAATTKTTELRARINLVDLAGSERAKATGATGETLKEGAQINRSLSTLGLVISALAELSGSGAGASTAKHIPYRDSTLTFLLKESLGGNSKTYMLSTLSPATINYDETLSTLRYADRAKQIVTRAFVNETAGDKRIRELENEVTRLREKIRLMMEEQQKQQTQQAQQPLLTKEASGTSLLCPPPPLPRLSTHDWTPDTTSATHRVCEQLDYDEDLDKSTAPASRRLSANLAATGGGTSTCGQHEGAPAKGASDRKSSPRSHEVSRTEVLPFDKDVALPEGDCSGPRPTSPFTVYDTRRGSTLSEPTVGSVGAGSGGTPSPSGGGTVWFSSPTSTDVNALRAQLQRAEEIIHQLNATDTDREQEVSAVLEAYRARTTVRLDRTDPYVMNLDGRGDWVVAHLLARKVHIGGLRGGFEGGDGGDVGSSDGEWRPSDSAGEDEEEDSRTCQESANCSSRSGDARSDKVRGGEVYDEELDDDGEGDVAAIDSASENGTDIADRKPHGASNKGQGSGCRRAQYVTLSGANDELNGGLGCPHCTLVRRNDNRRADENAASADGPYLLRPRDGFDTFLNGAASPVLEEVQLQSGDILTLGDPDSGLQLKFMDPSAPPVHAPMTARGLRNRNRPAAAAAGNAAVGGGEADGAAASGDAAALVPPLTIPRLALHTHTDPNAAAATSEARRRSIAQLSHDSLSSMSGFGLAEAGVNSGSSGDGPAVSAVVPALALGALSAAAGAGGGSRHTAQSVTGAPRGTARAVNGTPAPLGKDEVAEAYFTASLTGGPPMAGTVVAGSRAGNRVTRGAVMVPGTTATSVQTGAATSLSSSAWCTASSVPGSVPIRFVGRHTLLFLGPRGAGKTHCRENLRKSDHWYDFLSKREPLRVRPTWGVDRCIIDLDNGAPTASAAWLPEGTPSPSANATRSVSGGNSRVGSGSGGGAKGGAEPEAGMSLALMELSGCACFSLLQDQLPTRRVTYVLCFSLRSNPSLQVFRHTLEYILCQSDHRDASVVLMGTHYASSDTAAEQRTHRILDDLEREVQNYFMLLQPNPELRPVIVGRFAVDNCARRVFSAGFARVSTFPELLRWLGDHALQRCRNDLDFLNGRVPSCCIDGLASMVGALRVQNGKWCVASGDYKARARAVDTCYQHAHTLHVHTQLLAHWGLLVHRFRHSQMKAHVVVDVQWYLRLLTCIACCGAASREAPDEMLLCSHRIMHSYDPRSLQFDPVQVILADTYGLLSRGVMTTKVLAAITRGLIEADDPPPSTVSYQHKDRPSLAGIVALFQACDYVIPGRKLCFSPSPTDDGAAVRSESSERRSMPAAFESFMLLPSTFFHIAPPAVVQHASRLVTGPLYRFTFSMMPPFFFAKLVCRIAKDVCAAVYVGPAQRLVVDPDGPTFPLRTLADISSNADANSGCGNGACAGADTEAEAIRGTAWKGFIPLHGGARLGSSISNPNFERPSGAIVPGNQEFWSTAAWAVGAGGARALLRIVHHSLFISFNHTSSYKEADATFYDGMLAAVRSVVGESPGAQCEESILCCQPLDTTVLSAPGASGAMATNARSTEGMLETDPPCFYRPATENINSLEKVRERETYALQTARSHRPMMSRRGGGDGDLEDEDVEVATAEDVPFLRSYADHPLSIARYMTLVDLTSPMNTRVRERLASLLQCLAVARELCDGTPNDGSDAAAAASDAVGRALDALIDLLARIK